MPSPNNVLTADSYIQDGLVFQLDGIDYGGIDGQWVDRKQVFRFSTINALYLQNCFAFKNGRANLLEQKTLSFDNHCSFDIIVKRNNSNIACLFTNPVPNRFLAAFGSGNIIWFGTNSNIPYFRTITNEASSFSWKNQQCVQNGFALKNTTTVDSWTFGTAMTIAGRNTGSQILFNGSIYAIRVYSRQLSDREILINQKIDNARFGLGLDIPDEVLPASRSLSLSEPFALPDESETEQEPTNETTVPDESPSGSNNER